MILLLRHGETVFNVAGRLQGRRDSPLTAKGRDQATHMGDRIAQLAAGRPVTIHSSPLGRALTTARLIAQQQATRPSLRSDPRLTEISFGQWDGLTQPEIDARWPGRRAGQPAHEWFFHGPGGESLATMLARIRPALAAIAADPAALRVIVTHGITGWVVRMAHTGAGPVANIIPDLRQDALQHLHPDGRVELL